MANLFCPIESATELHLVDIENLLGTPWFSAMQVSRLRGVYDRVSGADPISHYLIGTSAAGNVMDAGVGWGQGRPLFRKGQDGAEQALLGEITAEEATRYRRVVIGSGDHIFVDFAAKLLAFGVEVTVVSRRVALSRALTFAVKDTRLLPEIGMQRVAAKRLLRSA